MEPQIKVVQSRCARSSWQSPRLTETSLVSARRRRILVFPRTLSTSAGWIRPYPLDPSSAAHAVLPVVDARADSYTLPLAALGCAGDGPLHTRAAPTPAVQLNVERQLSRQKSVLGGRSHFWGTALPTAPGSLPPSPTFLAEEQYQS